MTVTQTIFRPEEVSTLEALYPDKGEWWMFFHLLSDRIQEESEDWAEGMRFLYAIRQRPYIAPHKDCWFLSVTSEGMKGQVWGLDDKYRNYIPIELKDMDIIYTKPILALEAFLHKWATLSTDVRSRIWMEWVNASN